MANEKRLIDASALICDIQHNWDYASADGITSTTVLKQTITDIRNQPTVDAVEVVRCKDCKMRCPEDVCIAKHCTLTGIPVDDDDFCSYGERREGE